MVWTTRSAAALESYVWTIQTFNAFVLLATRDKFRVFKTYYTLVLIAQKFE